ncbi:MAG: hypothetical protein WB771_01005 [Solirubrobacterales bacterium]
MGSEPLDAPGNSERPDQQEQQDDQGCDPESLKADEDPHTIARRRPRMSQPPGFSLRAR